MQKYQRNKQMQYQNKTNTKMLERKEKFKVDGQKDKVELETQNKLK